MPFEGQNGFVLWQLLKMNKLLNYLCVLEVLHIFSSWPKETDLEKNNSYTLFERYNFIVSIKM